jgi:sugar/nucleoside kinase (ribokinase family)
MPFPTVRQSNLNNLTPKSNPMPVLVVGSIGLDTVKTPMEEHADLLGGSASYAAVGASFFSDVNLVGVVGDDFPKAHVHYFKSRGIDLAGLQIAGGKTFRWSGEYHWDMNTRTTRSTELNVFEHFTPALPPAYNNTPYVLLANIAPSLQSHVLDQMQQPKFIIADTMNLWIEIARADLLELLKRVDMLILNDSEARELTGETSLIKAGGRIRTLGPKYVAIKKGEHGCLLFGEKMFFSCGAYPRGHPRSDRRGRHLRRGAGWLPCKPRRGPNQFRATPQGGRLRQRPRQLQRRGVQPGADAQPHH